MEGEPLDIVEFYRLLDEGRLWCLILDDEWVMGSREAITQRFRVEAMRFSLDSSRAKDRVIMGQVKDYDNLTLTASMDVIMTDVTDAPYIMGFKNPDDFERFLLNTEAVR